jgi:hypothetical protein
MTKGKRFRRVSHPRLFVLDMKKESAPSAPDVPTKTPKGHTAKRRGEVAEAAFLSKAASLGFDVAKPWGDSAQFDFILHTGSRCWRVQVKSAFQRDGGRYSVRASGHHIAYTKDNIDFLVAYIVPTDVWYVLPVEVIAGRSGIWFSLKPISKSRFERYREAWCLMACPRDGNCSPEISVHRRCLAGSESGRCPFACGQAVSATTKPKDLECAPEPKLMEERNS